MVENVPSISSPTDKKILTCQQAPNWIYIYTARSYQGSLKRIKNIPLCFIFVFSSILILPFNDKNRLNPHTLTPDRICIRLPTNVMYRQVSKFYLRKCEVRHIMRACVFGRALSA